MAIVAVFAVFHGHAHGTELPSGDNTTKYVLEFLSSREGFDLNVAFARISDARVRQKLVQLVRELAGEQDVPARGLLD
jgi:hydrogenase/urease accessory protein HupE